MREAIDKVFELTEQIDGILSEQQFSHDREFHIEKLNELIEHRDKYIDQIIPPYTSKEKQIGKQIVAMNERISHAMLSFKKEIQLEIQQMKKTKQSSESYMNPYKNIRSIDGMYLDQKK